MSTVATIAPHEEEHRTGVTSSLPAAPQPSAASLALAEHPTAEQVVGAYSIHMAAEVIPLLQGEALEALVQEIAEHGQRDAVVIHDNVLIEGIDTVRAIGILKERGVDIALQTVPWQPRPGQTVPEYLAYKLLQGPRFTDAQRAQIAADLLPLIEQERATAQQSARIKEGEVRNPLGVNKRTSSGDVGCETHSPADAKARNKAKRERSTFGQIARLANVTEYAAKQAIKIKRHASKEDISAVKLGTEKPKAVLEKLPLPEGQGKKDATSPKPIVHPCVPRNEFEREALIVWTVMLPKKFGVAGKDKLLAAFNRFRQAEKNDLPTA